VKEDEKDKRNRVRSFISISLKDLLHKEKKSFSRKFIKVSEELNTLERIFL